MKLVKGDIIRNPWVSDPKWRDFIFIRRGKNFVHTLRPNGGLVEDAQFYKKDVDEHFTKVGHSAGFDTMLREVTGEEETR
ncbi:hypothetical protein I3F57_06120 [Lacticaseibacillus paracasei subsp. tolerans]|uniref:hypothetical protein n=1 Tax=Lacticaseibacillus paracasei TaxID=1597 RepID=UPI0018AD3FA5|nr:hypothetical protein [Lacticaseibacillus paracasei]QPI89318.1 hypothetical protein I3F57_06120 [Lacticaseibacillus paracasei subsp. tolerans]